MNNYGMIKTICGATLTALLLSGCGDDAVQEMNTGSGSLSVGISDAPIDGAFSVVISVAGITVKPNSLVAIATTFDPPRPIDLLQLQGGDSQLLLDNVTVPGGAYSQVVLKMDPNPTNSYLTDSNGRHLLILASGATNNLVLNKPFTVPQNGSVALTIDFDLRKSILPPAQDSSDFQLKPALRLVQNDKSGKISGTVPSAMVNASGCGTSAIYLYTGSNVIPHDVSSSITDPISSTLVWLNNNSGKYEYSFGFIPVGTYTISLTCQANQDNPETTDSAVTFSASVNTSVTAGSNTISEFVLPTLGGTN